MRISVNIVFKNHCMLIVTCMISHDKGNVDQTSFKHVSVWYGLALVSSSLTLNSVITPLVACKHINFET